MKGQKITIEVEGQPLDLLVTDVVQEMPGRFVLAARELTPTRVNLVMGEDEPRPERGSEPVWAEAPTDG